MGIHRYPRDTEGIAQNYICRLAAMPSSATSSSNVAGLFLIYCTIFLQQLIMLFALFYKTRSDGYPFPEPPA